MPVSVPAKFDFPDVGGSLNDGQPGTSIAVNEWQQLWNFYQFGTKLVRRGGMERETDEPVDENLTGLHILNTVNGDRYLLVGGVNQLFRQDGDTLVPIPRLEGGLFNSSNIPWVTVQRNDIAYWMRPDNMSLRRSSFDFVQQAGIEAPLTAPVLAAGAAGDLTAGDYIGVATFYNTATGVESNPSPVSNTLTLGANLTIDWSGIPTSSNPQVTARRLYRTVPNQIGRYFFVAQINDNSTTVYVGDNVTIQDLGIPASFRNGLPPDNLELGDFFKERLFASDGIDQFYSEAGNPESFDPNNVIPVFRNDGHRISANHAFGDRFMIGKTNKVHYILGTDPSDFSLHTLSDKHGCWSHHSMKSAEGNLFWYGGDNVYRSDGASVYSISTIKVKEVLATIPESQRAFVVGAIWPEQSWYMLSIPATPLPFEDEDLGPSEAIQRVENPGAEDGVVDPWVVSEDTFDVTVVANPGGFSGSLVFQLTDTGENGPYMEQQITIEDSEVATIAVAAVGPDTTMEVQFFAYLPTLDLWLHSDATWGAEEPWAIQLGDTLTQHSIDVEVPTGETLVLLRAVSDASVGNGGDAFVDEYTWTTGDEPEPPPEPEITENRTVLIYNYKTDVWTQFTYQPTELAEELPPAPRALAPAFILSDFNATDEPTLYATFYDGRVWRIEAGLTDDGAGFGIHALSKDHDFGATGLIKFLQRIYVQSTRLVSSLALPTFGVRLDGADGTIKEREVSLNVPRPWKRINLSTMFKPAYTLAVSIDYEGKEHFEVHGYSMEVLVQPRALQPL